MLKVPLFFLKWLLMSAIICYWYIIPLKFRKTCLFRVSCSHYVFNSTRDFGFLHGVTAFKERWHKCRPGYKTELINNKLCLHLIDGSNIDSEDISESIIRENKK